MGALTSTPKSLPEVVTVAAPASVTTTDTAATDSGASTTAPPAGDADIPTAARQGSLLERSRGLLSTVLTGFDGILNNTNSTPARKSLLGE